MYKRTTRTGTKLKRKTTNAAKQALYTALWGKETPSKYKKTGKKFI